MEEFTIEGGMKMKNNFTSVSLITSLYRSDKYLAGYLDKVKSVLYFCDQKYLSVEVVLVCNDATPSEKRMVEQLSNIFQDSERVSILPLFVPRETLYRSWNRGIKASSGGTVGFWNVDDIRYPEALVSGVELVRSGADLVYFPYWSIRKRRRFLFVNLILSRILRSERIVAPGYGRPIPLRPYFLFNKIQRRLITPPDFEQNEFMRSFHIGPFFLFSRSFYEKVGPFDEQFRIAGDFEWQARAAKVGNFTLSKDISGEYLTDQTGLSGTGHKIHYVENDVVYLRHGVLDKVQMVDKELLKEYSVEDVESNAIC